MMSPIGLSSGKMTWNTTMFGRPTQPSVPLEERGAVLPQALVGAVGPAEALAQQRAERLGRLGLAVRLRLVHDAPAAPQDRQREVGVLGQRLVAVAAGREHGVATPRAERARARPRCS